MCIDAECACLSEASATWAVYAPVRTTVMLLLLGAVGLCAVVLPLIFLFTISYGLYVLERAKYRHIPGPTPGWPLGNAGLLKQYNSRSLASLELSLHQEYGDIFVFFLGCRPIVVVSGAL
jgi:hypothetical protein